MGLQIGARLDSGFDDPIGMLADCHRRIEHFLNILCLVAQQAHGRMLSIEEASAIRAAQQYFREGGKRHTADEEESLFPRLVRTPATSVHEELRRLEADHQAAESLHNVVDSLYGRWILEGSLTPTEQQLIVRSTEELKQLYNEHIAVEERIVFPQAIAVLDRATVASIGEEFRKRRA